ncbi:ABC transporter permease [Spiroplasma endosymbiont of Polydrusus formosus]|uniref:ABC transporter permease n=1 Tax=Spiroplasma endosymbiont of Polydrusus formosus TaxID=3139326 RepID=UPI0035B4FCAE
MEQNETTEILYKKEKTNVNKKIMNFFTIKMFRYNLIKMLKVISTWVMFVLTLIVGLIMVLSLTFGMGYIASGDYMDTARSLFTIYSWIWYMLYFGLTSMFIGFKVVQLIRDEIDDGTLLIFSSIPISRTRMIIEKWLSLQLLCLVYSVTILLLPPLLILGTGQKGAAFGKVILSKINFMILTSFILQLFLTTIGILISLGLNSKGVIGILFTLGFLTVIGAMIPFIYNTSKMGEKSSQYLIQTADLAKNSVKFKDYDVIQTYDDLLNPIGWPIWTQRYEKIIIESNITQNIGELETTSLVKDIEAVVTKIGTNSIAWNDFIAEAKKTPTVYPVLSKLINDNILQFDGYKTQKFLGLSLEASNGIEFKNNAGKGINILSDFYNDVKLPEHITISQEKPSTNNKISLSVLKQDKLKIKTSKNIYKIIKAMYDKAIFSPTVIGYAKNSCASSSVISPYSITSLIYGSLSSTTKNKFNNFYDNFETFLKSNLYNENVYIDDLVMTIYSQFVSQMLYWLNKATYDKYGGVYDKKAQTQSELNKVQKEQTNYKLMAYLNIWQQWVVMWTGNASVSVSGAGYIVSSILLPVNNYLNVKVNSVTYNEKDKPDNIKTNYFLMGNFNQPVVLDRLTSMYIGYLLVTFGLAGLTLWWITRKDFV